MIFLKPLKFGDAELLEIRDLELTLDHLINLIDLEH